jgi:membrane fusion protein, heavy metal efflux system
MVNRKSAYLCMLLAGMIAPFPGGSHEGHDHGDGPPEQTAQSGPIHLSAEAKHNLDIKTAGAAIQAIERTLKASGTIQAIPGSRENISSKISGRISDISVSLGQFKRKGETIMILESRQLAESPVRVAVTAPRSGKVVRLQVIKGDAVEPGTSLLEMADYGEVYAVARVYESQIGKITAKMSARVYSPFLKSEGMASTVDVVGSEVNPQSRTVDVWLRVKNPGERLKINTTVNVYFLADKEEETIVVPRAAVLSSEGEKFVFVEEGTSYTRTPVVTGIENDKWIEIMEGLSPGDVVVTQGNYQLQFAKPKAVEGAAAKAPAARK